MPNSRSYAKLKAEGRCIDCGSYERTTKLRCGSCSLEHNLRNRKHAKELTAKGLCLDCGITPTALTHKSLCEDCRDKSHARAVAPERRASRRAKYAANDLAKVRVVAAMRGMTPAEYLAYTSEGCVICGSQNRVGVDHDHACCGPKRSCRLCNRGALCYRDNTGVGAVEREDALDLVRFLQRTRSSAPLVRYITELEEQVRGAG